MTEPLSPEFISRVCPVVLLGQELDMQRRQKGEIAASIASITDAFSLVGVTTYEGTIQPLVTQHGKTRSVRRMGDDSYDDRVTTKTPLAFAELETPYVVAEHDFLRKKGSTMSIIFDSGKGPVTSGGRVNSDFFLYQTYHPKIRTNTRTGFLGTTEDGGDGGPIIVRENGQKYVVEVKGAGTSKGSFTPKSHEMEDIVLGGLPATAALKEHTTLSRASSAGLTPILPLAFGVFPPNERLGDLGLVLRLSPSTLRLSHKDVPGAVPIESKADLDVVLDKLVTNFVNKFTAEGKPIFISPASHLENYLVHDLTKISETDFEDFREFGTSDLPFVHRQTATFLDTRLVILHYFRNFGRLDLFDDDSQQVVQQLVERKLALNGVHVDLYNCRNSDELVEKIWFDWLVDLEHAERMKNEYYPADMFQYIVKTMNEHNAYVDDSAISNVEAVNLLIRSINDGDSQTQQHTEFGHITFLLDSLINDEELTNAARLDILEDLHRKLAKLVASQDITTALKECYGDESKSFIPEAYGALSLELRHYTSLFRLVDFTNSWMKSEANNYEQLVDSGRLRDSDVRLIGQLSKHCESVMQSTNIDAIFNIISDLIEIVPELADFYYSLYSE